jgi:hypothetical protein
MTKIINLVAMLAAALTLAACFDSETVMTDGSAETIAELEGSERVKFTLEGPEGEPLEVFSTAMIDPSRNNMPWYLLSALADKDAAMRAIQERESGSNLIVKQLRPGNYIARFKSYNDGSMTAEGLIFLSFQNDKLYLLSGLPQNMTLASLGAGLTSDPSNPFANIVPPSASDETFETLSINDEDVEIISRAFESDPSAFGDQAGEATYLILE